MRRVLGLFLLVLPVVFGAEDAWTKVRELKRGAEVRVFKKGRMEPLLGKFDELTSDHLVLVLKNGQMSIAQSDITRVDARPGKPVSRFSKENKSSVSNPEGRDLQPAPNRGVAAPSVSSGTNVIIRSRPDFETIYSRIADPPTVKN
ncbi:MAG TPA: hypothetical protein VG672_24555 [Bryobacteraceae bacterium]|jgi:hypothetical protein|nr:hypothetical protein [Bryobacteraceae bacterium]